MARHFLFPNIYLVLSILIFLQLVLTQNGAQQHPLHPSSSTARPNILFILTDDQDLHMDSLSYMPYVRKHLIDRGTSFQRHYCTVALCCPSRVSMWTGKAAHNTNVTDINPPYGGYPKFISQGFNDKYLPVWLQDAGYATYYVGKLFNAQTVLNYDSPHAAGWTGSEFLLDPYTYRYRNATLQRNHDKPVSYEGQYVTDVIAEKAHGFLDDALSELEANRTPFFLTVAPTAPHSNVDIKRKNIDGDFDENTNVQSPPVPAERHEHLFKDVVVPRTLNFNPDDPKGASWISRLPKQNQSNVDFNDHFYRNRLRSLQAVDEMVDFLVRRLGEAGVLDNTFIVYSTDNGYTIGQHRRQPGKQCAFEQDINVPFIVRGPGIAEGVGTNAVTSHTDVAPTFLALTGARVPDGYVLDGQAMPLSTVGNELMTASAPALTWRQEHVNVEMWGIIMSEGKYGSVLYPNHTYKALRVETETYGYLYVVWCSGEHELYDMKVEDILTIPMDDNAGQLTVSQKDPFQLNNLLKSEIDSGATLDLWNSNNNGEGSSTYSITTAEPISVRNRSTHRSSQGVNADAGGEGSTLIGLAARLDALLMVLKSCAGRQCTHPWVTLFPNGGVQSLGDALNRSYDDFFQTRVSKVRYDQCEKGYLAESEGPVWSSAQAFGMEYEIALD